MTPFVKLGLLLLFLGVLATGIYYAISETTPVAEDAPPAGEPSVDDEIYYPPLQPGEEILEEETLSVSAPPVVAPPLTYEEEEEEVVAPLPPPVVPDVAPPPVAPVAPVVPLDPVVSGPKLTSVIEITKITTTPQPERENSDYATFQIADMNVYSPAGKVPQAAFDMSSSSSSPNVPGSYASIFPLANMFDSNVNTFFHTSSKPDVKEHSVKIKFYSPLIVSSIDLFNRVDCCWWRLAGAVLTLKTATGEIIDTRTLTGDFVQQYHFQWKPSMKRRNALVGW